MRGTPREFCSVHLILSASSTQCRYDESSINECQQAFLERDRGLELAAGDRHGGIMIMLE